MRGRASGIGQPCALDVSYFRQSACTVPVVVTVAGQVTRTTQPVPVSSLRLFEIQQRGSAICAETLIGVLLVGHVEVICVDAPAATS